MQFGIRNRWTGALQFSADIALRRVHVEAKALLRDLEAAANRTDGMELAGRFVAVLTAHIDPLRSAIDDVEFYDRAERVIAEECGRKAEEARQRDLEDEQVKHG